MQSTYQRLTKEEINDLPLRRYDGPIHVVTSLDNTNRAVDALLKERVIGFDTETRPAFRKGEAHLPSILQLAGDDAVYIFQLNKVGLCKSIRHILSNPDIIKCGIALKRDLAELMQLSPFDPEAVIDLGAAARRADVPHHGLRGLTALFLGFRISKRASTTNWSARKLSAKQITYAATDAWVGRELYFKFRDKKLL
ncbi:MAG: 3'-5' exonuclease [Candidatus Marinimicrobia bacterium]|jgi:ribonuclease D|nr:3'-5' exonuclease [Candidatus Neomarinimicrobiota bacterium]MDP6593931.1 3'-5' exonuclease [Candidatus Neomarinimicrobiota bacterium]MDP6837111.1 3'-5' exonuclease [Candidatus Neomarinimicrobiota bacterium]|tara:strand:- start:1 stop:588 length:588 start_codon:yes stop_codon:yes gene_type:complete